MITPQPAPEPSTETGDTEQAALRFLSSRARSLAIDLLSLASPTRTLSAADCHTLCAAADMLSAFSDLDQLREALAPES